MNRVGERIGWFMGAPPEFLASNRRLVEASEQPLSWGRLRSWRREELGQKGVYAISAAIRQ
jgi:hypothetical protein